MCLVPTLAQGQGHRGAPPGQLKKAANAPAPPAEIPDAPVPEIVPGPAPRLRVFGMWLDDATLAPPRSIWINAGMTRWGSPIATGVEAPSINVAAGLRERLQLSFAMSGSRAWFHEAEDDVSAGLGSVYSGAKLILRDPLHHDVGFSVSPTLEILSADAVTDGSSRAAMLLPLSFEFGRGLTRAYGSVGYYTRGATFASVAVERHLSPMVAITGALMQSWSTGDPEDADAYGLKRHRTDVAGGFTAFLSPRVAVYASLGRTISGLEFDSARYVFGGGMAIGFNMPRRVPQRPPK